MSLVDQPARQTLAMGGAAGIGANGVEHFEERPVALAVLLGQITDYGRKIPPGRRGMSELGAEGLLSGGERQHARLRAASDHRRELEKVADQHHLQAAERRGDAPDVTANCVD